MSSLKAGDSFHDFVGPLGCPSEFVKEEIEALKKKKMLFVAGGGNSSCISSGEMAS